MISGPAPRERRSRFSSSRDAYPREDTTRQQSREHHRSGSPGYERDIFPERSPNRRRHGSYGSAQRSPSPRREFDPPGQNIRLNISPPRRVIQAGLAKILLIFFKYFLCGGGIIFLSSITLMYIFFNYLHCCCFQSFLSSIKKNPE